jgi:hypothetical protein
MVYVLLVMYEDQVTRHSKTPADVIVKTNWLVLLSAAN